MPFKTNLYFFSNEKEDLNQYQEAELLNSEIMSKIQQDYDAWKAINGPIQIDHVSLSDLNQILKANLIDVTYENSGLSVTIPVNYQINNGDDIQLSER